MLITSPRTFGVEIEFNCRTPEGLAAISKRLPITTDGSLRHLLLGREYVSPILKGSIGEETLISHCQILKRNGAETEDPSTSVHVHLGIGNKNITLRSSRKLPERVQSHIVAVSNRLKTNPTFTLNNITKRVSQSNISALFPAGKYDYNVTNFNNVYYFSKSKLTKRPLINYTYYWIEKKDDFELLKKILYFYTQYCNVMTGIVSNSRKEGNMYCVPLSKSYSLSDIDNTKNLNELKELWYKQSLDLSFHYNDSRYHNVNLHSYWNRHGTVEIRSHGGTIDPNKILLWVKLHQKIIDKLSNLDLDSIKLKEGDDVYKSFIDFIEEPILKEYIKRLLGFYSGINIK